MESKLFEYDGKSYVVRIEKKRMRSLIRLTYHSKDASFYCSVHPSVKEEKIQAFLDKNIPSLILREKKRNPLKEINQDQTFLLGEKVSLEGEDLEAFLKKRVKEIRVYFTERTRLFEKRMGVTKPYRISIRAMKTRFGSNSSKTHSISYSLYLYRYDPAVIDSVIIHELTHDMHRNHGKAFYRRLYRYCPDYDKLRKRLIHNDFEKKEEQA